MAKKSLYVGNLPYDSTETELRVLFEPHGPIAEIRIIPDKGFAFVEIPEENMQAAIDATNGQQFHDRTLTVNEARPRAERTGSRGGYGGDRGGGGRRW